MPLTDQQILELEKQGYREGDYVPGRGILNPEGGFDIPPQIKEQVEKGGYASLTTGQKDIFNAPLVLSSNQGEAIHNENVAVVDNAAKTIEENKLAADTAAKEAAAKKAEDERKAAETKALTENIATGEGSNAAGARGSWQMNPKTGLNQFFPEGSTITFEVPEPDENAELDKEGEALRKEMEDLKISQDQMTQNLINSIATKYEGLILEQKEINRRAYARVQTAGLRSGSARYAPEIQSGIMSAEESAGLAKISKLESEKNSLIAEAQMAKSNKDIELLDKKIADYNARRKEQFELIKEQKKLQDAEEKKKKETLDQVNRDNAITDIMDIGITDPLEIMRKLTASGDAKKLGIKFEDIAKIQKSLKDLEKDAPGIIGEFLSAKENNLIPKEWTIDDYHNWKDPAGALAYKEKQLQIAKLEKELAGTDQDPDQILAYANQYASTGTIPTGLPKGTFGIIARVAKESPKATGTIVNKITGIVDAKTPSTEQQDYSRLYNIVNNVKRLKELDAKRIGGLISGILGKVFGSEAQSAYLAVRKAIVDDMQRMQSGAALTAEETAFYSDYLPGRTSESFFLGQDSMKKIENFETLINNRLNERLSINNLSIYGYSKIEIGGKEYSVGSIITNNKGQTGRVNPDGSITLIE